MWKGLFVFGKDNIRLAEGCDYVHTWKSGK
jgi:hypothetical protein